MSKTRELLLRRKSEISAELAKLAIPLLEEYKEIKRALEAIDNNPYTYKHLVNTSAPVAVCTSVSPNFQNENYMTAEEYNEELEHFFL